MDKNSKIEAKHLSFPLVVVCSTTLVCLWTSIHPSSVPVLSTLGYMCWIKTYSLTHINAPKGDFCMLTCLHAGFTLVQGVKNGHPSSIFICVHECLHNGQLLSADPSHISPLICCQPTTSWVHLVYCRVISCHKTNCSSSRLFSVCLYFCLTCVMEDISLAFLFTNGKSSTSPAPSWSR